MQYMQKYTKYAKTYHIRTNAYICDIRHNMLQVRLDPHESIPGVYLLYMFAHLNAGYAKIIGCVHM